jgi:hypothetical protein
LKLFAGTRDGRLRHYSLQTALGQLMGAERQMPRTADPTVLARARWSPAGTEPRLFCTVPRQVVSIGSRCVDMQRLEKLAVLLNSSRNDVILLDQSSQRHLVLFATGAQVLA